MRNVTQEDYRRRILGDKLDLSRQNKTIDDIAIGIYIGSVPNQSVMKRIKNLIVTDEMVQERQIPSDLVYPFYFKVESMASGYFLGKTVVELDTYKRLENILKGYDYQIHWVVDGVRDVVIDTDDLVNTIRFKKEKTIHDII